MPMIAVTAATGTFADKHKLAPDSLSNASGGSPSPRRKSREVRRLPSAHTTG